MAGSCGRLTERAAPPLNAEQLTFESSFQESVTNTGSCNTEVTARTTLMLFYWLTESVGLLIRCQLVWNRASHILARRYGRKRRAHHRPHRFSADPFDVTLKPFSN